MFNFVDVALDNHVEVEAVDRDGTRFYPIPGADKYYPSVTSITSFKNAQFFQKWRSRIGETEANRITARATQRGTAFHALSEEYFKGELNIDKYLENNPLSVRMFQSAKSTLNRIDNIHCLETFLYSHYLGLAGRVDCIAEFDGELAVIDFKTSTKEKKENWIEHYFVQETAYAAMFLERSGLEVKKIVTLIATEDSTIQVFEKCNLDDYLQLLKSYIEEFVSYHAKDNPLEDKFLTPTRFSQEIERMVKTSKGLITYIEAVTTYCSENEIEIETVPKLLSKPLKERLRHEAMRLNYMKQSSKGVLPL